MRKSRGYSVLWALTAGRDLEGVLFHIEEESPFEASRVLGRLRAAALRLNRFPKRGRVVPELREQGVLAYRELVIPPWRMIYRIEGARVWVLAVVDSRRDLGDLLLERFLSM